VIESNAIDGSSLYCHAVCRRRQHLGLCTFQEGLPDFSILEKMYQTTIKYTKRQLKRPNDHIIYQHIPLQDPVQLTQIWIFGLKICHLATLFPGLAAPMNFCTFTREHKRIESGKLLRSEHFSRGLPVAIPPPLTHTATSSTKTQNVVS
jgi:hypothetical protein